MSSFDSQTTETLNADIVQGAATIQRIRDEIAKTMTGQEQVVNDVLNSLLAGGHVLIEGVPGLGKTLLVRTLARCFAGQFARIQFTPDLMPNDITGHAIYDLKTEEFKMRKGPVFTNLLLADEINRAPAKTQAALLEVMQEKQITIDGTPYKTEAPFMVLATENPIEQEGTYPLPEAELDRFMMKIFIDYPNYNEEKQLVNMVTTGHVSDTLNVEALQTIVTPEDILGLQQLASLIPVDEQVLDYAVRLVRATRDWTGVIKGAGPRGSIAIIRAARANALLQNHSFVTPDDVKAVAHATLRHRLLLSAELEIEGIPVDHVLSDVLNSVEAPRL